VITNRSSFGPRFRPFMVKNASPVLSALKAATATEATAVASLEQHRWPNSVEQRQREIGIRIALRARPAAIGVRVIVTALSLTTAAIVAGLFVALLRPVPPIELYGVSPLDPLPIDGVSATLALTAALAAWHSAVRAARVDPALLLRGE
jgi:hypothetical protein